MIGAPPIELDYATRVLMHHHKPTAVRVMRLWWKHFVMDMHLRADEYTAEVEALTDSTLLTYWKLLLEIIHFVNMSETPTPEIMSVDAAAHGYLAKHASDAQAEKLWTALLRLHSSGISSNDLLACRKLANGEHLYSIDESQSC